MFPSRAIHEMTRSNTNEAPEAARVLTHSHLRGGTDFIPTLTDFPIGSSRINMPWLRSRADPRRFFGRSMKSENLNTRSFPNLIRLTVGCKNCNFSRNKIQISQSILWGFPLRVSTFRNTGRRHDHCTLRLRLLVVCPNFRRNVLKSNVSGSGGERLLEGAEGSTPDSGHENAVGIISPPGKNHGAKYLPSSQLENDSPLEVS